MSRILVIGAGAARVEALKARLQAAEHEPVIVDAAGDPAAVGEVDAIVVGTDLSSQTACALIKRWGCLDHRLPMIAESQSLCATMCTEGAFAGPSHFAIDDLMSPALPQLLASALAQHREISRLRNEVEQRGSAIGLIMGGLFQVRTLSEARNLSTMLSLACPDPARVVVGLRELIVNAIEHGNLGISCEEKGELIKSGNWQAEIDRRLALPEYRDRRATVQFRREAHRGIFQVRDEGAGFDFRRYLKFDPARLLAPNGRGIAMARSMSFDTLTYVGAGNDVIAITNFDVPDAADKAA
ncbi:MAG: ATP-binding protein [Alphaproteobacteria bacterium]|nr:ATP-binding protein [Alphaproteobacteria bacterium]